VSQSSSERKIYLKVETEPASDTSYEDVSIIFQTQSITKCTLTFGITHCCPIQRVMAAKLTRLTHKIAIQLHLVAESCTICSFHSRQPVQKLLDLPSCMSLILPVDNVKEPSPVTISN